jgi:peptidylprolyl isomerase
VNRLALIAAVCAAALSSATMASAASKEAKAAVAAILAEPTAADFRTVDPNNLLVIDTTKGRILLEMIPEIAPQSVARVRELAHEHFYDGLTFHRVVRGFMAQGGDPKGDGTGGSTKPNLPAEFTFRRDAATPFTRFQALSGLEDGFIKSMPVRSQNSGLMIMTADGKVQAWGLWCAGVAGMARAGEPDSGNSQFFLMSDFNEALERQYTPWAVVVSGGAVVKALKAGEPVVDPDKMVTVRVAADLPAASRPTVQVLNTEGAYYKVLAAQASSVCDVVLPSKVTP